MRLGGGQFNGTVARNVFRILWIEASGSEGYFELSADGSSFDGK